MPSHAEALRALLAELAGEDAAALVAETRAAGRADAAAVLRELWRDAYLERAGRPVAPSFADGEGWWVYCVIAADAAAALPAAATVAGGALETVMAGRLAAVASRVPLAEFGDEPLRAHLEDLAWVDRVARAHEGVLEALMATTTIVPLRLCTILLGRERVAALLDGSADELGRALEALAGRSEWGVKLFAPSAASPAAEAAAESGSAYLDRKRSARTAREDEQRARTERAQEVHDTLAGVAVAATVNPPQRREAHGRDTEMLLNGAYLVEHEREGDLRGRVDALGAELGDAGFALELTGPWPPYNFAAPPAAALS